jgi:hypothetical protein
MTVQLRTFRPIAPRPFLAGATNLLNEIHAAGQAVTYYTGLARTPGSGRAWTYTKAGSPTEHVLAVSPDGTFSVLFGGVDAVRTPKMNIDTWLNNALVIGTGTNDGGTVTTWDGSGANDPLGASKRFSGYSRATAAVTSNGSVIVYEHEDGIGLDITIGTSHYGGYWGRYHAFATSPNCSETDGFLYGFSTSGSTAIPTTALFQNNTAIFGHSGANGSPHSGYFVPRTPTFRATNREEICAAALPLDPDGRLIVGQRCTYRDTTNNKLVGVLPGVHIIGANTSGCHFMAPNGSLSETNYTGSVFCGSHTAPTTDAAFFVGA